MGVTGEPPDGLDALRQNVCSLWNTETNAILREILAEVKGHREWGDDIHGVLTEIRALLARPPRAEGEEYEFPEHPCPKCRELTPDTFCRDCRETEPAAAPECVHCGNTGTDMNTGNACDRCLPAPAPSGRAGGEDMIVSLKELRGRLGMGSGQEGWANFVTEVIAEIARLRAEVEAMKLSLAQEKNRHADTDKAMRWQRERRRVAKSRARAMREALEAIGTAFEARLNLDKVPREDWYEQEPLLQTVVAALSAAPADGGEDECLVCGGMGGVNDDACQACNGTGKRHE